MRNLLVVALLQAGLALGQLSAPNAAGVSMGHLHIKSRDMAAQHKLWIDVLQGQPGKLGRMETAKFPGVVILYEQGEPTDGTVGSNVNHLGFLVKDLEGTLEKVKAAGFSLDTRGPTYAFIYGPDKVRIELGENKEQAAPIVHHHVHFFTNDVEGMKAWYVKTFTAIPGRRGNFEAADLPGANLTFGPPAAGIGTGPTKGRSLDHIGFEVKDLEAFTKRLEAAGVKFDVPYKTVPALGVSLAFLTDPWGTYIELTEGLSKK